MPEPGINDANFAFPTTTGGTDFSFGGLFDAASGVFDKVIDFYDAKNENEIARIRATTAYDTTTQPNAGQPLVGLGGIDPALGKALLYGALGIAGLFLVIRLAR